MNDIIDINGNVIWSPDPELCASAQEELNEKEWMHKHNGINGVRPSTLGIEKYRYGNLLHKRFYDARIPPQVPLDSSENLEWYEEQLHRCIYGYEYKGTRITGDYYWFLNFTPFLVAKKDKYGYATTNFDVQLPYFSHIHDYVFKLMEEAMYTGKILMYMSARGVGKTYSVLSVIAKYYHLFPKSHNVISASGSGHANEAFSKFLLMLDGVAEIHPTLALARLKDTNSLIESGYEIVRDGVKYKEGPRSRAQKVIYGDNPGVTKGSRPDTQLLEEIGAWSSGQGSLKKCLGESLGSWRVGKLIKTRVFMTGTGGSVQSDQAKEVASDPDAYNILPISDFKPKVCLTIPAQYCAGGFWEKTGVNDNEGAKAFYEEERERTKGDMAIHQNIVQEFPFNFDEMFLKTGNNIFDQEKIGLQWVRINSKADDLPKIERGSLEWIKAPNGKILGVKWTINPEGAFEILEHPYRGKSGKERFPDLYVMGVDSIDMGQLEGTSSSNRSNIAALVKKRVIDGAYFSETSNLYVAKYINRSKFVTTDYENVLKLALYYGSKVNVEYTKVGVITYFKTAKQSALIMRRPAIAMPKDTTDPLSIKRLREQTLIGTQASGPVIDHQDMKIKEYVDIYYQQIFFIDQLENLRDYRRNDRRKYDLAVAMGLAELADEELLGAPSVAAGHVMEEFVPFGWYIDPNTGYKKFGKLPGHSADKTLEDLTYRKPKAYEASWIDLSGTPRFDDKFDIVNAEELDGIM